MTAHDVGETCGSDVLVVGAGPVGLTAACELRRRGVAVRCVDASTHRTLTTGALGLQARTLELFERLGVVETAVKRGLPVTRFTVLNARRPIAHFDLAHLDTPYPYLLMLPQNETEEILENRLGELGGVVDRAVELTGLRQDADGVTAVLAHRDGRHEQVRTRWLVGCDGAQSTVRSELGLAFEGGTYRQDFATADIRVDWQLPMDELFTFLNRGKFVTYVPMTGGWHRVAIAYPHGSAPVGAVTLAEVQRAMDACGPRGGRVVEIGDRSRFVVNQCTVENESSGRVLLAGDAAHVHSVVGAQGLNIGVQDAFNLGWKLAAVVSGQAPRELLATYPIERKPTAQRITKGTRRARRLTLLHRPFTVFARGHAAPLLLDRPGVRASIENALSQLDVSYRGQGAENPEGRCPAPGNRAPDGPVRQVGTDKPSTLFETIAGDEFSLLLVGSGVGAATEAGWIQRVTEGFPLVRTYLVLPDGADGRDGGGVGEGPVPTLVDVGGALRRRYDIAGDAMLLVRPDGYLGLRLDAWAPDRLLAHLCRWFIPQPGR